MRRSVVALATAGLVLAGLVVPPMTIAVGGQGTGNPILSIRPTTIDPSRVVDITVTGTDYLVPPYAPGTEVFGGVYVLFGWVADPNAFGPSIRNSNNNNGTFGVSYVYPGLGGDANIRDDGTGVIRLVSFTPGSESGGATDYHMDREGNWTAHLRVFGSTFTSRDPRTGETIITDCLQVQCGVFTIGAHGKISATNEKFTPINFATPATTTTTPATTTTTSSTTTTTTLPVTTTTVESSPSSTAPTVGTTTTPGVGSTIPGAVTTTIGVTTTETSSPPGEAVGEVVATRSTGNGAPLMIGSGLVVVLGAGAWLVRRSARKQ